MEKIKRTRGVFILPLWLAFVMALIIAAGCTKCTSEKKTDPPTTAFLPGQLYKLVLTKAQYDTLVLFAPGDSAKRIKLHFYFNDAITNYPTLIAYPTKKQHYERHRDSTLLTPTGAAHLTLPSIKSLSTQSVRINKIEKLLNDILGVGVRTYDHLLFTPNIDTKGHIYYKITVICLPTPCPAPAAGDVPTNPSPPKDTD